MQARRIGQARHIEKVAPLGTRRVGQLLRRPKLLGSRVGTLDAHVEIAGPLERTGWYQLGRPDGTSDRRRHSLGVTGEGLLEESLDMDLPPLEELLADAFSTLGRLQSLDDLGP